MVLNDADGLYYTDGTYVTLFVGWDSGTSSYYLAGVAVTADAYHASLGDTGWDANVGVFYISGAPTGLNETGEGTAPDGYVYAGYPWLASGWCVDSSAYTAGFYSPAGVYYGQTDTNNLDQSGNGVGFDGITYVGGNPLPDGWFSGLEDGSFTGYYLSGRSVTADFYNAALNATGWDYNVGAYYLDGLPQPGIDSGGNGTATSGLFYQGGSIYTGWDDPTGTYYVNGIATTLDTTGGGYNVYDGLYYSSAVPVGVGFNNLTLPAANQVQSGVSFGYPGNTLVGTQNDFGGSFL